MKIHEQIAIGQLRHDRGNWRKSIKTLKAVYKSLGRGPWRAHYAAAARQIVRWRLEARRAPRGLRNPLSKRAAAVLRREFHKYAGEGMPQRAAWALAYRYARGKGLVE